MVNRWLALLGLMCAGLLPVRGAEEAPTFENLCASCHGLDGSARTPQGRKMQARDLRESRLTDAEITRQIRFGSRTKTGSNAMPAVGRDLKEAEVEALVRAVKAFRPASSK